MKSMNRTSSAGFTLVETLVAISIASVLSVLAGSMIFDARKQFSHTEEAAAMQETLANFKRILASDKIAQVACKDIIQFSSPFQYNVDPIGNPASNPQTDIQIKDPTNHGVLYSGGQNVREIASFTISKLYLADVTKIRTVGTGADQLNSFIGTVWLEGSYDSKNNFPRKSIMTLNFTMKSDGTTIAGCNSTTAGSDTTASDCSGVGGLAWDGSTCRSVIMTPDPNNGIGCQNSLALGDKGVCNPHGVACPPNQIATGAGGGQVLGCTNVCTNPAGCAPAKPNCYDWVWVDYYEPSSISPGQHSDLIQLTLSVVSDESQCQGGGVVGTGLVYGDFSIENWSEAQGDSVVYTEGHTYCPAPGYFDSKNCVHPH